MTIRFDNTIHDAMVYNEFCHFNTPRLRKRYLCARWMMPLFAMSFSFLLSRLLDGSHLSLSSYVSILITGALITLIYPYLHRIGIRQKVRAQERIGGLQGFLGEHTVTIGPDGVRSVATIGQSLYPWNAITSVMQGKDQIYLFVSEAMALSLPRRAFADTAQEAIFLAEAERYRAGAVASPATLSLTPTVSAVTNEAQKTPISNAPWWSGQTTATLDAEAQNRTQRHGG
ncbi:MAG: YcxB family protein [bacterium]